jgi:iron-sulfur cluster assembly protein
MSLEWIHSTARSDLGARAWGFNLQTCPDKVLVIPHKGVEKQMTQAQVSQRGIQLSEAALQQVKRLRDSQGTDLCLRVGVRQGGCSGMSYMMDFEDASKITPEDEMFDYDGFKILCDRKSLLYLYGLMLDYSDAMIGGGFQFTNPNANQTCGCGKSFGV